MEAKTKDLWVFIETEEDGSPKKVGLELLNPGRRLADKQGGKLVAVVIGDNIAASVEAAGSHGADQVIAVEGPEYKSYSTDAYANALCHMVEKYGPSTLMIGATPNGRDMGPRVSCRLNTGLTADCTAVDIDEESGNVAWTRPAFGGNLMATIICPRFRPSMATVRPGVMKKAAYDEAKAKAVKVTKYDVKLDAADLQTEVVEVVKAAKKLVDLIGADYIVSVGRGISKDVEGGIKLAHELADVLGGVVGGSRVAIDSGWLTADHQVGQTGKTVHPKVYVALGISGSIQHKAGMSESECIIAVNKNETAPIFEIADYGICGDLFKVTPMLIEAFKAAKASK